MAVSKRGVLGLALASPGWVFALLILIGLGIAVPAEVMFERAWRLQMGGATVEGTVDRLWTSTRSCGKDNMDTCTDYNVDFGFDPGTWRQTEISVTQGFFEALKEGGPIPVRYVRDDPTIIEVESGWTFFEGILFLYVALTFLIGGGFGLGWRRRLAHRLVTLRETGERRQAMVTAQERTNFRVTGTPLYRLRWRDEAGVTGQSQAWPQARLPALGSAVTIYADPAGNLPPVWEGDCGAR